MSEDHRGTVHRVDNGAQILGLPLRCVRRGVAAVTPTATIVGDALQASLGERGNQRTGRLGRRKRAPDEDHRSSGSEEAISDPSTVGGFHILDRLVSQDTMSSLEWLFFVSGDTLPELRIQRTGGMQEPCQSSESVAIYMALSPRGSGACTRPARTESAASGLTAKVGAPESPRQPRLSGPGASNATRQIIETRLRQAHHGRRRRSGRCHETCSRSMDPRMCQSPSSVVVSGAEVPNLIIR